MNLFTLMATIGLDTTEFEAGVRKSTQAGQGLATGMTTRMKATTVAIGNLLSGMTEAAVKFLMEVPKAAINAAAEVKEENANFSQFFGDLAGDATKSFQQIGKETNILSTRLNAIGTTSFQQLTGAGIEAGDALSITERMLRLSADAAAVSGMSIENANDRLRSFMRGNTEAGDSIGLFTTESQRNADALEMYGVKWQELTESQRQMVMLNAAETIYNLSKATGQAAREGSNWANVTANLQEAWRQTLATVGAPLMESFTPFLEKVSTWLADEATQAKLADFAGKLGEIAALVFDTLLDAFDWCLNNGQTVATAIELVAIAFVAVQTATNPIGTLFAGIIAIAILLMANWESLKAAAEALGQKFQDWIVAKLESIKTWAENAKTAVSDFISIEIPETIAKVVGTISDAWDKVTTAVSNAIAKVKEFLGIDTSKTIDTTGWSQRDIELAMASGVLPTNAKGLDYVPFDNYVSRLHRGEAILTAREAEKWRAEQSGSASASGKQVTVNQYIDAVPQTPSEIAFETANALRMLRFNV